MVTVRTAGPLGYCFGVSQAIDKVEKYADEHGKVYSLGTLAHNENVVEYLRQHQVEPIEMEHIVSGMHVAITAHGAPPETYRKLEEIGCLLLDCTCPIVRKAQTVVSQQLDGFDVLIFGDPKHQEVKALNGWAGGARFVGEFQDLKSLKVGKKVGIVSQTTKIPAMFAGFVAVVISRHIGKIQELRVFNTICPIVAARVNETRKLAGEVDMMFVVGSQESANTQNLVKVASEIMEIKPVFLVLSTLVISPSLETHTWHQDWRSLRIGVTAGTSTPIEVVERVVQRLKEL